MNMQPKLVMTLFVRDEEDILEENITFHLAHGVDFIVAIDNGSKDSTRQILKKYSKKGILSYQVIRKHTYEQSRWVSEMAKRAVEEFGATHIFHCDADEFWLPKSGNLKSNLPLDNEVMYVPASNYLPPRNFIYKLLKIRTVVTNGFNKQKDIEVDMSSKYLLFGYYPKVFTSANFKNVSQGNHDVIGYRNFKHTKCKDIIIRHFPIRSYAQFEKKVANGGSSYKKNPNKNAKMGWHKKAWYEIYLKGQLEQEYQKIVLTKEYKSYLLQRNIIKDKLIHWRIILARYLYTYLEFKQYLIQTIDAFSKNIAIQKVLAWSPR